MPNNTQKKSKLSLVKNHDIKHYFNSFFAGIGGFDLGFQNAGIGPAFHCEINEYCNSVLDRHWPDVPQHNDINSITTEMLPEAEIWCGGFPCQDVSLARSWRGREGLKGKNSGLFYPFFELIKAQKPKIVILENVTGLLSSHEGNDFRIIIQSLTDIGYAVAWRVLNTRYFGSPQSRPRVFISAAYNNLDIAINNLYEADKSVTPKNARKGFLTPSKCNTTGAIVAQTAYCLAATSGRHTGTDWSRSYISYKDKVRRMTPTECEGVQGFPTGWSFPSDNYHLSDEDIDTLRYHALGNAVSVRVVEWIGKRIVKNLDKPKRNKAAAKLSGDKFLEHICAVTKNFNSKDGRLQSFSSIEEDASIKWKSGGCAYKEFVFDIAVSPAPIDPIDSQFISVIERNKVDEKYFLSPNAAEGILRRVNSQNRTLFGPLTEALEKLAKKNNKDTVIQTSKLKAANG